MASPTAIASASSSPVAAGAFQDALGNVLASGKLTFDLSQTAAVSGGGELVARRVVITLDVNGKPSAGQSIFRNTDLTPSGTTYLVQAFDSTGNFVGSFGQQVMTGTAPIDITLMTPTQSSGGILSFANAVLQNPPAAQTITGQSLSLVTAPLNLDANSPLTTNGTVTTNSTVNANAQIIVAAGSNTTPSIAQSANTNTGFYFQSNQPAITNGGVDLMLFDSGGIRAGSGKAFGWSSSADPVGSTRDTGLTRVGAGIVSFDTNIQSAGTGKAAIFNATTGYQINGGGTSNTFLKFTGSNYTSASANPAQQIFTGNGTFTIPAGIQAVKVTVVGAGGAGGGATTTSGSGSGGNSGGASIKWLTGLTPGNTLTVTVGTGGTGNANAAGNTGGNSSVASGTQTITTITATGGQGGQTTGIGSNTTAPGTGGDLNFGGNVPPVAQFGNSGSPGAGSIFGGAGPYGLSGAGQAGNSPGAGGGGAGGSAAGPVAGGNGANGLVIFEWIN